MALAIEARGLEKTFVKKRSIGELMRNPFERGEAVRALRGVDLLVEEGEIFTLLGPNGAGKTTLLKILSCLVLPDRGTARVGGFDILQENRVKKKIGLVTSDERSFYWRLSARENLRFFAHLYDVPSRQIESRVDELLAHVDLSEAADRPFSTYSSGMKQRVAIARALLHDPPILFMDEPTRSLDPATTMSLRQFIRDELMTVDTRTILLATHNLREAEALSSRLGILVRGRVRQVGTVSEVRRWGVTERQFAVELGEVSSVPEGPYRVVDRSAGQEGLRFTIALHEGTSYEELLRSLLSGGGRLLACDRVEPDLEDAFSRILEAERDEEAQGVA